MHKRIYYHLSIFSGIVVFKSNLISAVPYSSLIILINFSESDFIFALCVDYAKFSNGLQTPEQYIGSWIQLKQHGLYGHGQLPPENIAFRHAFCVAERFDNPEIIRIAARGGAIPDKNAIQRALYISKKKKNLDFLQATIDAGTKPTQRTFRCAVILAEKTKNSEYLKKVVECGAQASHGDNCYQALLHLSIVTKNPEFIELGIQAGATPCSNAIHTSCEMTLETGDLYYIKALLRADPDTQHLIRYDLAGLAKGRIVPEELRQNLIKLVGFKGRDFFK